MRASGNDVLIDRWPAYIYILSRGTALGEMVSIPREGRRWLLPAGRGGLYISTNALTPRREVD